MAMMGSSSAWNGPQDTQMQSAADDDFQRYLDMNLADGLQFDFQFADFQPPTASQQDAATQAILQSQQQSSTSVRHHHHVSQIDIPMTGTDMPAMVSATAGQQPQPQQSLNTHLAHVPPPLSTRPTPPATVGPAMVGIPAAAAAMMPSVVTTQAAPPTPSEAINDIDAKIQFLQHQRMQQQQRQMEEQQVAFFTQQSRLVPPTPQSLDIQAGASYYVAPDQTPQQGMYERYQRMNDEQDPMSFTPLVSPAVTPMETHFSIDSQFNIPSAYFSPLASPALHAQVEVPTSMFDKVNAIMATSSPGEMDLETPTQQTVTPSSLAMDAIRKPTRKSTAPKPRGKGSVRQSPISKPQRKKTQTTPIMNSQALSELAESLEQESHQHLLPPPAPHHGHGHGHGGSSLGLTDSENGSVSPETLSDMPPPPVPKSRSARLSPYIEPQGGSARSALASLQGKMSPATPASLMRLTSPSSSSVGAAAGGGPGANVPQEPIDTFELPESVNFQQKAQTIHRSPAQSPFLGPVAASTPAFQPLPSAAFAKHRIAVATTQSPLLSAQGGASAAATPTLAAARKTPQLGPRGSKKRASVSSSHVSPALRPRISPSIKPLLPGGAGLGVGIGGAGSNAVEDAASLLLASKSNYQNILEGNNVPGVSYPSELSTNLTSKRTSHKLAEQGRRNRINSALQEMATLLPPAAAGGEGGEEKGDEEGEGKKGGGGGGPNSKASTVEMAIEYIKLLKKEVADATRRAEEAERQLATRDSVGKKAESEADGVVVEGVKEVEMSTGDCSEVV